MPLSPPDLFTKHPKPLAALALSLALMGVFWPKLAILAFLVSAVVSIGVEGRPRWVALLAALLGLGGTARFLVVDGASAILLAGQRSAEERAVSRLREVHFAQLQARQRGIVPAAAQGPGQFLFLGELVGADRRRRGADTLPLLKTEDWTAPSPEAAAKGIYRADSYLYVVYLPDASGGAVLEGGAPGPGADRGYVAYAWPTGAGGSGHRLFFIDQDERICETFIPPSRTGLEALPNPFEALASPDFSAARCAPKAGGHDWRPWKRKKVKKPLE